MIVVLALAGELAATVLVGESLTVVVDASDGLFRIPRQPELSGGTSPRTPPGTRPARCT